MNFLVENFLRAFKKLPQKGESLYYDSVTKEVSIETIVLIEEDPLKEGVLIENTLCFKLNVDIGSICTAY